MRNYLVLALVAVSGLPVRPMRRNRSADTSPPPSLNSPKVAGSFCAVARRSADRPRARAERQSRHRARRHAARRQERRRAASGVATTARRRSSFRSRTPACSPTSPATSRASRSRSSIRTRRRSGSKAIYQFPLPENAAVTDMMFRIGKRVVISEVKKREEARQTYERAKAEGHTAALTEQERPNLFTQSVANIPPGESVEVVIRYVHEVKFDSGRYQFHFPTTIGPRYNPSARHDRRRARVAAGGRARHQVGARHRHRGHARAERRVHRRRGEEPSHLERGRSGARQTHRHARRRRSRAEQRLHSRVAPRRQGARSARHHRARSRRRLPDAVRAAARRRRARDGASEGDGVPHRPLGLDVGRAARHGQGGHRQGAAQDGPRRHVPAHRVRLDDRVDVAVVAAEQRRQHRRGGALARHAARRRRHRDAVGHPRRARSAVRSEAAAHGRLLHRRLHRQREGDHRLHRHHARAVARVRIRHRLVGESLSRRRRGARGARRRRVVRQGEPADEAVARLYGGSIGRCSPTWRCASPAST